jgi:CubicO group peptidase (beta-lactamase class C family)
MFLRLLILLSFSTTIVRTLAQAPAKNNSLASAAVARIDSLFKAYAAKGFTGTVLVRQGNADLLTSHYGLAEKSTAHPNDGRTLYEVASISKLFTAAAILRLEEQGKLKTSDRLSKYIGAVPKEKQNVTIENLLFHNSGFCKEGGAISTAGIDSFILTMKSCPLEAPAGEVTRYSNAGYTMLAAIIQKITGKPYEKYIRKEIIRPAGPTHILFSWDSIPKGYYRATGYKKNGATVEVNMNTWFFRGAGGMIMTAGDLSKWIIALNSGHIISKKSVEKMFKDHTPGNESYALNKSKTADGKLKFAKGGGYPHFETQLIHYPENKTTAIFFMNNNSGQRKELFPALSEIIEKGLLL